ncbi:phosphoribosylglycinamide formyltransferase [Tuwongella immobilis]|uniref:phosphoribosylglycinamide formyltransferase n=1 Tax=Tuwongella immobilis TaxID=692036 RepID=UPI001E5164F7|nr:phosphoribosylglycinamide formyltransferase [Tuwongella immobilis]
MPTRMRIAVLLSGGGTTLQNLLDRIAEGSLPVEIALVISSRAGVKGIERAERAGIPTQVMTRKAFGSIDAMSEAIFSECRKIGAELICLAGYLQRLRIPADFVHRVINIHPSLLPAFGGQGMYGHHVHEAVLAFGAKVSGCTVHFTDDEYDHGPIIAQRAVPVLDDDTPETLAARVFEQECQVYPEVIRSFALRRLRIDGRCVRQVPG